MSEINKIFRAFHKEDLWNFWKASSIWANVGQRHDLQSHRDGGSLLTHLYESRTCDKLLTASVIVPVARGNSTKTIFICAVGHSYRYQ